MNKDLQEAIRIYSIGSHKELNNFVADSRIKNYCRDGLVEKEVFNKTNGEQLIGYKLTKEGKSFVEKNYGFTGHQHSQSLPHDLGISDKYFSLTEAERETWRTETELRTQLDQELERMQYKDYDRWNELTEKLKEREISVTDCSYTTGGITIVYEVVTNSYGRAEIQAKEEFATVMNTQIEFGKV